MKSYSFSVNFVLGKIFFKSGLSGFFFVKKNDVLLHDICYTVFISNNGYTKSTFSYSTVFSVG